MFQSPRVQQMWKSSRVQQMFKSSRGQTMFNEFCLRKAYEISTLDMQAIDMLIEKIGSKILLMQRIFKIKN